MDKREVIRGLRLTLGRLFPDSKDIEIIIHDSGLARDRINLGGSARQIWQSLLDEACRTGRIINVYQTVIDECQGSAELIALGPHVTAIFDPTNAPAEALDSDDIWDQYRRSRIGTFTLVPPSVLSVLDSRLELPLEREVIRSEDIYEPLALTSGAGSELGDPVDIMSNQSRCVVRGPFGSGKTMWLWHLMLVLLQNSAWLPVYLPVSVIVDRWLRGPSRSTPDLWAMWLQEVADFSGKDEEAIKSALRLVPELRPALLLDGFEEAGGRVESIRQALLALTIQHPDISLIITSRRHDLSAEIESFGFVPFDLLPMDDQRTASFVARFFRCCRKETSAAADVLARRIVSELSDRLAHASDLMHRPLFLALALSMPQPSAMTQRPHALLRDFAERKILRGGEHVPTITQGNRIVDLAAGLAAAVLDRQAQASEQHMDAFDPDELASLVPSSLEPETGELLRLSERLRFIHWLARETGVLTRREGGVAFSHRAMLEVLAAWWTCRDLLKQPDVIATSAMRSSQPLWHDPLVMGVHMLCDESPQVGDDRLGQMTKNQNLYWLASILFAEGRGSSGTFTKSLTNLGDAFDQSYSPLQTQCALAWADTRLADRRGLLVATVEAIIESAQYYVWRNIKAFSRLLELRGIVFKFPVPSSLLVRGAAEAEDPSVETPTSECLAFERVVASPAYLQKFRIGRVVLYLAPCRRAEVAARLQLAVACGASRDDMRMLSRYLFRCANESVAALADANELEGFLVGFFRDIFAKVPLPLVSEELVESVITHAARSMLKSLVQSFRYSPLGQGPLRGAIGQLRAFTGTRLASVLLNPNSNALLDFIRTLSMAGSSLEPADVWKQTLGLASSPRWLVEFASMETGCIRWGEFLASLVARRNWKTDVEGLITLACIRRIAPEVSRAQAEFTRIAHVVEVVEIFWPLFARRIAGELDVSLLLETFIKQPELIMIPGMREGVRIILRGDVLMEDGQWVLLDELASEIAMAPLPLVDV